MLRINDLDTKTPTISEFSECSHLIDVSLLLRSDVTSVNIASVSLLLSSSVNSDLIAHHCGESMFQVQVHTYSTISELRLTHQHLTRLVESYFS